MFDTDIPYISMYGVRDGIVALEVIRDVTIDTEQQFISMSDRPGSLNGALLLTSGIACAAIFLDLTRRWYISRRHKIKKLEHRAVQTDHTERLGLGLTPDLYNRLWETDGDGAQAEALPPSGDIDNEDILRPSTGYTLRRNVSRSTTSLSSRRSSFSRQESLQQALLALQQGGLASAQRDTGSSSSGGGLQDVINDLVESMRCNVQLATEISVDGQTSPKEKIDKIRDHHRGFNELTNDVTNEALCLVDLDSNGADDRPEADIVPDWANTSNPLASYLTRRAVLRGQWLVLRRLLFCVDLHLRNSAAYHLFFEDARALRRLLVDVYRQYKDIDGTVTSGVSHDDIQSSLDYLGHLQTNVHDLVSRANQVIPIHMRQKPLTEPISARAICSITTDNLSINEGESLVLLDNKDIKKWRLRNSSGEETELPAMCVLIPPPDQSALLVSARLQKALDSVLAVSFIKLSSQLLRYCIEVLQPILHQSDVLLSRLTSTRKADVIADLQSLADTFEDMFMLMNGYSELKDTVDDLMAAVEDARVSASEDSRVQSEVSEPIRELCKLLDLLRSLDRKKRDTKAVLLSHGVEQFLDEDSLDWVTELVEGQDEEDGLAISVHHQETSIAESSSFTSSTGEVRQTFSVRGVLDPRDQTEMSITTAIEQGILDQTNGLYIHPTTKEKIPIPVAMSAGLILVEATQTKKEKEETKAVGLVTVKVTRETRPYTVKKVSDPASEDLISVAEAIDRGIFDPHAGVWLNTETNEKINVKDAIDTGLIMVDYDSDAEETEPEVTTRTFAVYGVLDRKAGRRLPFQEACDKGIFFKEEAEYFDTKAEEKISVVDAAKNGWVKVRVVDDPSQLQDFVSRNRSDSMESAHSASSIN